VTGGGGGKKEIPYKKKEKYDDSAGTTENGHQHPGGRGQKTILLSNGYASRE